MRHNVKKIISLLTLVCLFTLPGFSCKGLSKTEQQAIAPVSLEYWTVYDDVEQINAAIAKYTADRSYLKVTVKQLRSDEIYNRLVEALAEDKGPDIVSVHTRELPKYAGKLAAMPAFVRDTTVKFQKNLVNQTETIVNTRQVVLPTIFQIDKEYVQAVKKDVVINDKIYGLPLSLDTMAIYYNKDLLDRAQIPEPPTTWTEFQEAVKKISKYNVETGKITQSGAALGGANNVVGVDDLIYVLFGQSNVKMTADNAKTNFNVPPRDLQGIESPAISVMNFYSDFSDPTRDTYSWNESMENSLESFIHGKTAFFFGFSYHNAQIKTGAPQLNYGILPMIQLNPENPVNAANYWVQTVTGKSKKQNEAWGLINYLAHSSATKTYLDATKRPTALRSLVAGQKEDLDLAPFVSQLLVAENWYRGANYAAAVQAIKDMILEWRQVPVKLEGRLNDWHQDVLNRAAAKINQTL